MRRLKIGTRGSRLALWQARHVADRLRGLDPALVVEIVTIRTRGDRDDWVPSRWGEKGIFVREIEQALEQGDVDCAVHSLKDLPSEQPSRVRLAARLLRHDPRDALLTPAGVALEELPQGACLATTSLRRRGQLLHIRPDLRFVGMRGNVDTRVGKMRQGASDGIVLALAGLERLGLRDDTVRPLPTSQCLPAVGQGIIVVEVREDDHASFELASRLDDPDTAVAAACERAFLRRLGGGCLAPATAFARVDSGRLRVEGVVCDPDGRRLLRRALEGPARRDEELGEALAVALLEAGGEDILREAREAAGL
jgi:hydroxymethylbilane synthase